MDLISPIEDSIIKRLKEKTCGKVLVEPYPENPATYEPTHAVGALLVRYSDADYSDTRDTNIVLQDRDMQFEITLAMWSLRGKQGGIYAWLEAVRIGLTGFRPPNCTIKMTPVSEGFVSSVNLKNKTRRLWQYQITFRTQTMNIEMTEEEQGPVFTQITTINATSQHTLEIPE